VDVSNSVSGLTFLIHYEQLAAVRSFIAPVDVAERLQDVDDAINRHLTTDTDGDIDDRLSGKARNRCRAHMLDDSVHACERRSQLSRQCVEHQLPTGVAVSDFYLVPSQSKFRSIYDARHGRRSYQDSDGLMTDEYAAQCPSIVNISIS
jgi:hypothetical protein